MIWDIIGLRGLLDLWIFTVPYKVSVAVFTSYWFYDVLFTTQVDFFD